MATTYTKLRSGDWGIRSTSPVKDGETVTVTKKDGSTKQETVSKVLWSGNGVWLAAIGGNGHSNGTGYRGSHAAYRDGHHCRNGHAPHPGPCCTGRHRGGDDCGADCCELD